MSFRPNAMFKQLVLIAPLLALTCAYAAAPQKHRVLVVGGIHQSNVEMFDDRMKAMLWVMAVSVAKETSKTIAEKNYPTFEYISDSPSTARSFVGKAKAKVDECLCTLSVFVKVEVDLASQTKQVLFKFFAVPESNGLIYLEPMLETAAWHSTFAIPFTELARYKEVSSRATEQLFLSQVLTKTN